MKRLCVALLLLLSATFSKAQSADSTMLITDSAIFVGGVKIFEKVEIEAQFPGGLPAWRDYLVQNMKMDAIMAAVPRRVKHWEQQAIVQFIVDKDGSISNIKVINNVTPAVAREAKRIIAASPNWNPARQGGRAVKAYRKQPITFVVDSE